MKFITHFNFNLSAKEFLKKLVFRYTKLGKPTYPYNVEPIQLAALINTFEELRSKKGCLVEIGVARGQTTKFLANHVELTNYKEFDSEFKFYAIDTFSSFVEEDINWEVNKRGKNFEELVGFEYNKFEVWIDNFKSYKFIEAFKSDCSKFDFSSISPIKMAFLDVDLYLPTKKALQNIYPNLIQNGYIFVDDVKNDMNYDGAFQAYNEFCDENGIEKKIIGNKCGIIRKL